MPLHPSRPSRRARRSALAATTALVAGLLSAVLVTPAADAAPVAPAAPAAVTVPTPPAISWSRCAGGLGAAGAQCGFVTVPLDYNDRSAGTIKLAVSRVKHTTAAYQGVVLVNPGGPGGSGLSLSTLGRYVPNGVGSQYDWIGFDPRGVGSSVPSIHCDPGYFGYDRPDYVATTPGLQRTWLNRAANYSQACATNNDLRLLNHVTTRDSALDMESIRLALGQKQINYYGFSYGTYLGSVYMSLFPHHMRRAVLDSTVDPRQVWYAANNSQDVAFTTTSKAFFAWVAAHDDFFHLGSSESAVEALYYGVLDQLRRKPQNGGRVGPDEWNDAFVPAGYYQLTWNSVAQIFVQAVVHHDFSGVTASIEGPTDDDNGFAMYLATQCTDTSWPSSYTNTWKPDALRISARNPFLTWSNVWYNAPCLTWPAAPHTPVEVDGSAAPPILMVDEQYDAATPYAGSVEVRKRFPKASLIKVVGGTSHAVTLFGNACTDNAIAKYLANGTLPTRVAGSGPDKTCQPLPEPTPGAGKTSAAPRVALPGRVG
ncbi:alpha/beta hydrolase [Jatrophihabitans sp. YIM 134969]